MTQNRDAKKSTAMLPSEAVAAFMGASGHKPSADMAALYMRLVREEFDELRDAWEYLTSPSVASRLRDITHFRSDVEGVLDGLADLIWVAYGMMLAMGAEPESVWGEVRRANMDKIDPETGRVLKREDGKVMKPEGWRGPDHAVEVLRVEQNISSRQEKIVDGQWRRADGTAVFL